MSLPVSHHATQQSWFTVESLVKNRVLWPAILIAEVFIYSSYGIFINLSRIDGRVKYHSSSLVFAIETMKLNNSFLQLLFVTMFNPLLQCFCPQFSLALLMAWPEISSKGFPQLKLKDFLPFAVPAACYCLNNNLAVYMQDQMDPASFQVLCNLKIASTAVLYRIIMNRRLSHLQWISLGLLTLAGALNSYSGLTVESASLREIHVTPRGLFMALLYSTISGFAGVYTEYILKRDNKISLPFQSCFLYIFGMLFNLIMWVYQADEGLSLFHGYNIFTWAVIACQAVNGLVMSLIMKHSSNIVRLFIISSAIPVATLLSVFIFHLQPGLLFLVIVVLVMMAIYLYNYVPKS